MSLSTLHTESKSGTLTRVSLKEYLRLVEVDVADESGDTALSLAIRAGHVGAVKLLLQHGADPNKTILDGRSPPYLASFAKENGTRIAELLLKHKADVNQALADWGNETPLMAAIAQARDPQLVRLLVENGASLTSKNDRGETAKDLARQSTNPSFTQALLPKDKQENFLPGLSQALRGLGMVALNYFLQYKDIFRDSYKDVVAYSSPSQQPGYSTKQVSSPTSSVLRLECLIKRKKGHRNPQNRR